MSEISKEVAYLKGLAEGMSLSEKSEEGKLIGKLIDVLADCVEEIDALWARNDELEIRLDEMDEEIYAAEMDIDDIYDLVEDTEAEFDFDDEEYYDDEDDDLFDFMDDEADLFEITCPECGEDVVVDFDMLDEEHNIVCPNCNQEIELDIEIDDEDEDV